MKDLDWCQEENKDVLLCVCPRPMCALASALACVDELMCALACVDEMMCALACVDEMMCALACVDELMCALACVYELMCALWHVWMSCTSIWSYKSKPRRRKRQMTHIRARTVHCASFDAHRVSYAPHLRHIRYLVRGCLHQRGHAGVGALRFAYPLQNFSPSDESTVGGILT